MSWTNQEHEAALQAARAGQADKRQLEKLANAAARPPEHCRAKSSPAVNSRPRQ